SQLNGAHLWISSATPFTQAELAALRSAPGVVASTDPIEQSGGYVRLGERRLGASLTSFSSEQPAIGKLLMVGGQGLAHSDPEGVILDQPFAIAHGLHVGATLTLITPSGSTAARVRGLAQDVNHPSSEDGTTAQVHLLPTTLDRLFPAARRHYLVGIQLA